jgi:hypothetical protein
LFQSLQTILSRQISTYVLLGPRKSGKSLTLKYTLQELSTNYKLKIIYVSGSWGLNEASCRTLVCDELGIKTQKGDYLVESLQEICKLDTTPVFILDDFDLMMTSCQKFIYSLLDTQHYTNIHMLIFMITQNYGFSDYLDRRITSRLGLIPIYFFQISEPIDYYREILTIEKQIEHNEKVETFLKSKDLIAYLIVHGGFGIEFYQNHIRTMLVFGDWEKFTPKVSKLEVLKDLPLIELITFLIVKKNCQTSETKHKTQWMMTKYREFLFGTKRKEDSLLNDSLIQNSKSDDSVVAKAIIRLRDLCLLDIKKEMVSLTMHPNEVDRYMTDKQDKFPSELRSLFI